MERRGQSSEQFFSHDTAVDPAVLAAGMVSGESSFGLNEGDSLPIMTVYQGDVLAQEAVADELDYASAMSLLNDKIRRSREEFLEEKMTRKGRLAYAVEFDIAAYDALNQYKWVNRSAYEEVRNNLNAETEFNLVTLLGEKYNAELSRYTTRLEAGGIYPDNGDEPMREMVKRGAQYRIQNDSKEPKRELAVVDGFMATEQKLMDPDTLIGTTILSISPTGPQHEHNFYDTATKREDEERGVYIEWRRYSSANSRAESAQKLAKFDSRYTEEEIPDAEYFLRNVVTFVPGESEITDPDEIHRYLQKEHAVKTEAELRQITDGRNQGFRDYYITVLNDPTATYQDLLDAFVAIINHADSEAGVTQAFVYHTLDGESSSPGKSEIAFFAALPMQSASLPCGLLGAGTEGYGFGDAVSAYGMGFYGGNRPEDDPSLCKCSNTKPHFHCPGKKTVTEENKETGRRESKKKECSYKIVVGMGISTCPDCGESKKC